MTKLNPGFRRAARLVILVPAAGAVLAACASNTSPANPVPKSVAINAGYSNVQIAGTQSYEMGSFVEDSSGNYDNNHLDFFTYNTGAGGAAQTVVVQCLNSGNNGAEADCGIISVVPGVSGSNLTTNPAPQATVLGAGYNNVRQTGTQSFQLSSAIDEGGDYYNNARDYFNFNATRNGVSVQVIVQCSNTGSMGAETGCKVIAPKASF